jgi:hypothetical protein
MERPLVAEADASTQSCAVVLCLFADGQTATEARIPHSPMILPGSEQDPGSWCDAPSTLKSFNRSRLTRGRAWHLSGEIGVARVRTT